jgi:hypothetical protein
MVPDLRQEFRVHPLVGTTAMECKPKTQPLKRSTLLPFSLKQINPTHILTYHIFKINFNIILSSITRSAKLCFLFIFSDWYLWLDHHHQLPPWIRSFDLFQHRCIAIISWGIHDLFSLEVCSWGRVSGVWCCPFFQDGWSSFICVWISRLVFQSSLVLFL